MFEYTKIEPELQTRRETGLYRFIKLYQNRI